MRVDEAGNDDLAANVDLAHARIFAERSDDPVVADRDVALDQFAADEIEDPPALEHDVGLGEPLPLFDGAAKKAMASLMIMLLVKFYSNCAERPDPAACAATFPPRGRATLSHREREAAKRQGEGKTARPM